MKLDATNKTQEISVREDIDGSIEVSVRNRKKNDDGNNNERVYEAESREELKKQAPEIVRMIERYEKMAGSTKATVVRDSKIKAKKLLDTRPLLSDGGRNDAQQMMRDQLQEMLDNNADNPQIQKMIRKMIEGLNQ